jgi:transposase InsO family protein
VSKARLILTALTVEKQTVAEVAARYGVHRSTVHRLKARYDAIGEAAFEPLSRRPHTSPTAISPEAVELIRQLRKQLLGAGHDAGPDTIAWHLSHHHEVTVSTATIARTLTREGLVVPQPAKRPRSSYLRFEATMPNETWQSDFTHYRLTDPDGTPGKDTEIITWLDDHARYALHISAHHRVTGPIVLATFRQAADLHGHPASTLTDNGMVYTTRYSGGRGGRNHLEHELRRLQIVQKNSRPHHPTTCGKVERFQQTLKKWLRAQRPQPTTPTQLQALLDQFRDSYNHHRPHRSLPQRATPATVYNARPKATPSTDRSNETHDRVRTDRLDNSGCVTLRVAGRLHHIGVGRTHARTHVYLLVHDLEVRIINAATGELLRELTIDPTRDYQPTGRPPGPPPKTPK